MTPKAIAARTPEAIAARTLKATATRKLNKEREAWHLANDAAFKATTKAHYNKLASIVTMADDVRGNENENAVAAVMYERVLAKRPKIQRAPWEPPPLTKDFFVRAMAERQARQEAAKLARKIRRATSNVKTTTTTTTA
jgi:hypothetical protein